MLFSTPTQFAVLALVLVAGWFFGLASHPGGRKWRDRYTSEREAHALNRQQAEAHVAEQKARAAELERENVRLNKQAAATPVVPITPAAPISTSSARPTTSYPSVRTVRPSRGWFDWH
jgi:hypothetical protein